MNGSSRLLTAVVALGALVPGCARASSPSASTTPTPRDTLRIERDIARFNIECGSDSWDVGCNTGELVSIQLPPPDGASEMDILGRVTLRDFLTDPVAIVVMDIQPPKPEDAVFWPEPLPMAPGEVEVRSASPTRPESRTLEWVAEDVRVPGAGYTVGVFALQQIRGSGGSVVIEVRPGDSGPRTAARSL